MGATVSSTELKKEEAGGLQETIREARKLSGDEFLNFDDLRGV